MKLYLKSLIEVCKMFVVGAFVACVAAFAITAIIWGISLAVGVTASLIIAGIVAILGLAYEFYRLDKR